MTNIYTKEMADNGELPSAGMEVKFDTTFFTTITSNRGTCEIIAYYGDKVWINIIDFDCVINLSVIDFEPITPPKTDKEKALDDMAEQLDDEGIFTYDQAILKILIDKIKGDKIHGMVWVGD